MMMVNIIHDNMRAFRVLWPLHMRTHTRDLQFTSVCQLSQGRQHLSSYIQYNGKISYCQKPPQRTMDHHQYMWYQLLFFIIVINWSAQFNRTPQPSSSRKRALALVLLALQHSHMSHRRSLIFLPTIYIFAIWHHRLISQSRTTGLLVRQYFYFRTEYSYVHLQLHCRKSKCHQYGYRK